MEVKEKSFCDNHKKIKSVLAVLVILIVALIVHNYIRHFYYPKLVNYYATCYEEVKLVEDSIIKTRSVEGLVLSGRVDVVANEKGINGSEYDFIYENPKVGTHKIKGSINFNLSGEIKQAFPDTFSKQKFIKCSEKELWKCYVMTGFIILGIVSVIGLVITGIRCCISFYKEIHNGQKKEM